VDLRVTLPDESEHRMRLKAPLGSKSAAQRWGEERERHWYHKLTHPQLLKEPKDVPTLRQFAPRFVDGHARANRQKPSDIAAKEMILRVHLVPAFDTRSWTRSRARTCSASSAIWRRSRRRR
jgi:hypothetical protein